jgi:hypothetical protein
VNAVTQSINTRRLNRLVEIELLSARTVQLVWRPSLGLPPEECAVASNKQSEFWPETDCGSAFKESCMPKKAIRSNITRKVRVLPSGETHLLTGQLAQLLHSLNEEKACGMTSLDALFELGIGRAQARISELRQLGFEIETTRERAAGGASIGRYWLRCTVEFVCKDDDEE